jgi:hypothetical protein
VLGGEQVIGTLVDEKESNLELKKQNFLEV